MTFISALYPFDLHVKQGIGIQVHPGFVEYVFRLLPLVVLFDQPPPGKKFFVINIIFQLPEFFHVPEPAVFDPVVEQTALSFECKKSSAEEIQRFIMRLRTL